MKISKEECTLPEVVVIRMSITGIQVCAAIPPERIDEVEEKVLIAAGPTGTEGGKWELPDFDKFPNLKPVPCDKYEERWHYVLEC